MKITAKSQNSNLGHKSTPSNAFAVNFNSGNRYSPHNTEMTQIRK